VVTQQEDPAAPADFTDSMVVGNATTYAGGTTSATGTTVRKVEVAGKGSDGAGAPAAEPAPSAGSPDRSRRARLSGDATWACDFPREADEAQIDHAVVTLRIAVDIQGAVNSATIVTDPGSGFGREARACAMLKHYEPALNRDGRPVAGTSLVNVRFDR
jgi:outer membrane biosynthesis protein TonB